MLPLASSVQATVFEFGATLTGSQEIPPSGSPGIGTTTIFYDSILQTLTVNVTWSGLLGTTTASHIHCCTALPGVGNAGVATTTPYFAGFPIGVTSGTFNIALDLTASSSYNLAFITANGGTVASAEPVLTAGLLAGDAYLNIHSTVDPTGEIRGYLKRVPEPATLALFGFGVLGLGFMTRRRALVTQQ